MLSVCELFGQIIQKLGQGETMSVDEECILDGWSMKSFSECEVPSFYFPIKHRHQWLDCQILG